MNCTVCGSSEFVTNDGITYCTECQCQIEETQTEVAVEPTLSRDIGSTGPKKKTVKKEQEEYSDWVTIECYNHILYMQVSSLIKLGASPKLKNTVLHIWSKYLQSSESAFRIDYLAKDGKPCLGSTPFKRDINVLYGNKKISCGKRKRPEDSDELPIISADEAPSLDDTNAELETNAGASVSTENKCIKPKYSSHARKKLRRKKPTENARSCAIKQVHNMTLAKTLSICYLGLLYTEDKLSLCDLIRFVYEEKIPYVNLLDKLPSTMKFHTGDCPTFLTYVVPDAYSIQKTSRDIMHFAKLPEYKEPSVYFAAARFVRDFNLPGDLLPIVSKLADKYKEQISKYSKAPDLKNVPPEHQALTAIIVAIKLLFILDDKFEIEHSNVMNKLNALQPDKKYFEWKEWKKHSMVKEFLFLSETPGYSVINNLDSLSANLIISKYPFTRLKPTSSVFSRKCDVPVKHCINKVLSSIVHIPSDNPSIPTSFPLRRAVKCFMEEWKTLPAFKETKEIDFTLLKKDFSSCSLFFDPLQFDKVEDELSYLMMTSLYLPDTTVAPVCKKFCPSKLQHEVICTTSSYWVLKDIEAQPSLLDKLPNSFKWLVNYFSKYAYCSKSDLYKEVGHIERVVLLQKWSIRHSAKINNKLYLDF